ncbi:MAG: hypothetical protein VYA17_07645 [Pseudomonadota bacterium]|nr:hypothetical protein [Pseudomonadota bacterium]
MSLAEINADDATGDTKRIYEAIEVALGVRLVNLVYRHLATVPGALEWAWAVVGQPFQTGVIKEHSEVLVSLVTGVNDGQLAKGGGSEVGSCLTSTEHSIVCDTLSAYNRANPMNAIGLLVIALALKAGRPARFHRPEVVISTTLPELLPLGRLEGLNPQITETLNTLASLTADGEPRIVPSLYRHFINWPAFLTELVDWLEPLSTGGTIDRISMQILVRANEIAKQVFSELPVVEPVSVSPDIETRSTLIKTIEIFPPTICRMIVIGAMLCDALRRPGLSGTVG